MCNLGLIVPQPTHQVHPALAAVSRLLERTTAHGAQHTRNAPAAAWQRLTAAACAQLPPARSRHRQGWSQSGVWRIQDHKVFAEQNVGLENKLCIT